MCKVQWKYDSIISFLVSTIGGNGTFTMVLSKTSKFCYRYYIWSMWKRNRWLIERRSADENFTWSDVGTMGRSRVSWWFAFPYSTVTRWYRYQFTGMLIVRSHTHHRGLNPNIDDEFTYTLYSMVITIPDVACTRCSLHLANMKTSDEGNLGSSSGRGWTNLSGTCQTVYHSCTLSFTIIGSMPRLAFQCTNNNPTDWPKQWIGDNGATVSAGTVGVYQREAGT